MGFAILGWSHQVGVGAKVAAPLQATVTAWFIQKKVGGLSAKKHGDV